MTHRSIQDIFHDFDVSGDEELDYKEFKMFAMACIDKQREMEEKRRQDVERPRTRQPKTAILSGLPLEERPRRK